MKPIVCMLSLVWILVSQISSNLNNLASLYLVSDNQNTQNTTIWEYSLTNNQTRLIYEMDLLGDVSPDDSFSDHERQRLAQSIERGEFPAEALTEYTTLNRISGIWPLSDAELLVLTRHDVCSPTAMLYCYGHFEFLVVDLAASNFASRSLLKFDFHDRVVEDWVECTSETGLTIDAVNPSPDEKHFVFTVRPLSRCYPLQDHSAAYLVDYENATTVKITNANGVSWSPDGTKLAYYLRGDCDDTACESSINLFDVQSQTSTTLYAAPLYYSSAVFTTWTDDTTVMFQWLVSPDGGEGTYTQFWQNIVDHTIQQRVVLPHLVDRVYALRDGDVSSTVALIPYNHTLGFSPTFPQSSGVVELFPVTNAFYNSRFNAYLPVNLDDDHVQVIRADLQISTLDLSDFHRAFPDERIVYVAVGTQSP